MDRIRSLLLLIDIAEAGSFSAVARQRGVATSTVTLAINQLEEEFGVQLMVRSTRQLVFTHEGNLLLDHARPIVSRWDAAMSSLRDDGPLAGPIRVTTTNDFGRTQLRRWLDRFQERHPGVHISLALSDDTIDLIDERVDLALRAGPLRDSSWRARLLIRGNRMVCASPEYWARAGKPSHPNDLSHHNCLILTRPGSPLAPWPFWEGGKLFNVKVSGDREVTDGDVLREWAIDGVGVVIKNRWDVANELRAGTLESVLEEYVSGEINLYAVHPSGSPSRRVAALVDYLAGVLAEPPQNPR